MSLLPYTFVVPRTGMLLGTDYLQILFSITTIIIRTLGWQRSCQSRSLGMSMSDCNVPFLVDGGCRTMTNLEPSLPWMARWNSPVRWRVYLGRVSIGTC